MTSFNCREEEKIPLSSLFDHTPLQDEEKKMHQMLQKLEEAKRKTYNIEGQYQLMVSTSTSQDEQFEERKTELEEDIEKMKKILKDLQENIELYCSTVQQIQPQTFEEKKKNLEEKLTRIRIPDDSKKWCDFCQTDHINTSVPFCVACKSHHNTRENMLSTVAYLLKK